MATVGMPVGDRRTVRHVDIGSAARVSFALGLTVGAILIVGLGALYLLGMASGALGSVEGFIASLGWDGFRIRFFALLPLLILLALMGGGLAAGAAAVLAMLYNALSDLVGGVEFTTKVR